MIKICSVCKQAVNFPDGFPKDNRLKSGRASRCKACDSNIRKKYFTRNTDGSPNDRTLKKNAYMRMHLQNKRDNDPQYKQKKAESDKKNRQSPKAKLSHKIRKYERRSENAIHKISIEQWNIILNAFGHKCAYCESDSVLTVDHFIPLKHGGHTVFGNVVPACMKCNCSKQNKLPELWCTSGQLSRINKILLSLYTT